MRRNQRVALALLLTVLLSSCGGGGTPASAVSIVLPPPPGPPKLKITAANAATVATESVTTAEYLLQLAVVIEDNVIDAADVGSSTAALECISGSGTYTHSDNDMNGTVGAGDVIELSLVDCLQYSFAGPVTGQIIANITELTIGIDHSVAGTLDVSIPAPVSFHTPNGIEVLVSGDIRLLFSGSADREEIRFTTLGTDEMRIRVVDSQADATRTVAKVSFSRLMNDVFIYTSRFSYIIDSTLAGGEFDCQTTANLEGELQSMPGIGSIECIGDANSAVRVAAGNDNRVLTTVDPEGDGSFGDAGPVGNGNGDWSDYLTGPLSNASLGLPLVRRGLVLPVIKPGLLEMDLNDIVYSDVNDKLYVVNDTSLIEIDAASMLPVRSLALNNAASAMAIADDGSRIWIAFKRVRELVSVDTATMSVEQTVVVGDPLPSGAHGNLGSWDIEFMPGTADYIAVAMSSDNKAVAFRNGIELPAKLFFVSPDFAPGGIEFRDAATLIGIDRNNIGLFTADANGLTFTKALSRLGGRDFTIGTQNVFVNYWRAIDIDNEDVVGVLADNPLFRFNANGGYADKERNLFYAVGQESQGDILAMFDQDTLLSVGAYRFIKGNPDNPWLQPGQLRRVLKTRHNQLVFAFDGIIHFFRKSVLTRMQLTEPCNTTDLGGQAGLAFMLRIECPFRDAIYDASRDLIYASVPGAAGPNGNSVAIIDPQTGMIQSYVFAGSEPGNMSISASGNTLFVALEQSTRVALIDLQSRSLISHVRLRDNLAIGSAFPIFPRVVISSPTNDADVIVMSDSWLQLYSSGLQAPNMVASRFDTSLAYSVDGDRLFVMSQSRMRNFSVDVNGITATGTTNLDFLSTFFKFENGFGISSIGEIVDLNAGLIVGVCPLFPAGTLMIPKTLVEPDPASDDLYFWISGTESQIVVCNQSSLSLSAPFLVPNIGQPVIDANSLLKAGANRLIITTDNAMILLDPTEF